MEIILASNNKHKLEEIQKVLKSIKLITLDEMGFFEKIEETADTFQGNALIKCETIYSKFSKPVISDDSGLVVDCLGGAPGVYSSRYAGENATDSDNYLKLLRNLKNITDRRAKFVTTICYYKNPREINFFTGELKGVIADMPKGKNGFGYDPIFIPDGYSKALAEISLDKKNSLSHRARALKKFVASL